MTINPMQSAHDAPRCKAKSKRTGKPCPPAVRGFRVERGGWLVSLPGDHGMRLQTVPESLLPDQLLELGYIVERTGETERILPNTVIAMVETYDLRVPPAAAAPIPEKVTRGDGAVEGLPGGVGGVKTGSDPRHLGELAAVGAGFRENESTACAESLPF
jgi:hypothetical protein